MQKEDIVRKIQGLLAIAKDNCNDAESQSALLMAQKMMMKHNIEMSEVQEEEKKNSIVRFQVNEPKVLYWYEIRLAQVISNNFKVELSTYGVGRKSMLYFYGYKDDCDMAREVYFMALQAMLHHAKDYVSFYYETEGRYIKKTAKLTSEVKNSYLTGFLYGLKEAFKKQTDELVKEYGLVVLTPVEVTKYFEEETEGAGKKRVNDKGISDINAFHKGLEQGKKMNTNPLEKIGGE